MLVYEGRRGIGESITEWNVQQTEQFQRLCTTPQWLLPSCPVHWLSPHVGICKVNVDASIDVHIWYVEFSCAI